MNSYSKDNNANQHRQSGSDPDRDSRGKFKKGNAAARKNPKDRR